MISKVYSLLLYLLTIHIICFGDSIIKASHSYDNKLSTDCSQSVNFDPLTNPEMLSPQKEDEFREGYLQFGIMNAKISNESKEMLGRFARVLNSRAMGKAVIKGHGSGDKIINELVRERVNSVIDYLVQEMKIPASRITFVIDEKGDFDTVNFEISEDANTEH